MADPRDIARSLQEAVVPGPGAVSPPMADDPMATALAGGPVSTGDPKIDAMLKAVQAAKDKAADEEIAVRKEQGKITSGPFKSKAGNVALKLGHGISEGWKRAMQLKYGTKMDSNLPNVRAQQERRIQQLLANSKNAAQTMELMAGLGMEQHFKDKVDRVTRERDLHDTTMRDARNLGIKTEDKDGNIRPVAEVMAELTSKKAAQQERKTQAEEQGLAAQANQQEEAKRKQALDRLTWAIEAGYMDMKSVPPELVEQAGLSFSQVAALAGQAATKRSFEEGNLQSQIDARDTQTTALRNEIYDLQQWEIDKQIADIKGEEPPKEAKLRDPEEIARRAAARSGKKTASDGVDMVAQRAKDKARTEAIESAREQVIGFRNMRDEDMEGENGRPMDPQIALSMMIDPLEVRGMVRWDDESGQYMVLDPAAEPVMQDIINVWQKKFGQQQQQ